MAVPADVPVMLTGLVEPKVAVGWFTAPLGPVTATVSVTAPVKLPEGVTVMVLVPPTPAVTVRLVGAAEIAKP